jgi:prepilin-type processing-associated H-X9-DG protein
LCPSEPNDQPKGSSGYYPGSYGAGVGEWFCWDAAIGKGGNGVFPPVAYPSQNGVRLGEITDGTSTTIGFAEVKAFGIVAQRDASVRPPTIPATIADLLGVSGLTCGGYNHHTWALFSYSSNGLTFTFPPNTYLACRDPLNGRTYDTDWAFEGSLQYGAMTARSYHAGGVNALFMDGSVRFVTNAIPQMTWRAMGTRNGGEVVADF